MPWLERKIECAPLESVVVGDYEAEEVGHGWGLDIRGSGEAIRAQDGAGSAFSGEESSAR